MNITRKTRISLTWPVGVNNCIGANTQFIWMGPLHDAEKCMRNTSVCCGKHIIHSLFIQPHRKYGCTRVMWPPNLRCIQNVVLVNGLIEAGYNDFDPIEQVLQFSNPSWIKLKVRWCWNGRKTLDTPGFSRKYYFALMCWRSALFKRFARLYPHSFQFHGLNVSGFLYPIFFVFCFFCAFHHFCELWMSDH